MENISNIREVINNEHAYRFSELMDPAGQFWGRAFGRFSPMLLAATVSGRNSRWRAVPEAILRRKVLTRDIIKETGHRTEICMADEPQLPPEHGIVSARTRGSLSVGASFESLYRIYRPVVAAWLAVRVESRAVEDLLQDVWTVFYQRWQTWQQPAAMDTPAARPVLSFLFRTVHLATKAYRRTRQDHEPIDGLDPPDEQQTPQRLIDTLALGQCLALARAHCSAEDVAILTGKLAGVPAREIARTLAVSEPVIDHRYRKTLARLQQLQSGGAGGSG